MPDCFASILGREAEIEAAWRMHTMRRRPDDERSPELLRVLAGSQGWRCCYCGEAMEDARHGRRRATFEHVIPASRRGSHRAANLVAACQGCNELRGNDMRAEHVEAMAFMGRDALVPSDD